MSEKTYTCAFLLYLKGVVHMEVDWYWKNQKINLRKEGNDYELWRIWWTICATRVKRKIK